MVKTFFCTLAGFIYGFTVVGAFVLAAEAYYRGDGWAALGHLSAAVLLFSAGVAVVDQSFHRNG